MADETADIDLTSGNQEVQNQEDFIDASAVKVDTNEDTVEEDNDFVDLTQQTVQEPEKEEEVKEEVTEDKQEVSTEQEVVPNIESSLTEENQTEPVQLEVTDDVVSKYLSEKLGRQFDLAELTTPVEPENPLDKDPYLKELVEWRDRTGRPIEDWVKFQQNPEELSDVDVARRFLQNEYTDEEIVEYELNKLLPNELDDDSESNKKKIELKKLAIKGRNFLKSMKSELNTPSEKTLSPEIQSDLQLLEQIRTNAEQQKQSAEVYQQALVSQTKQADIFPIKLSDDLEINFKLSDVDKNNLPKFINEMSHWRNEDGSYNHKAIVDDGILIAHKEAIFKSIFDQGVAVGKESIDKEVKNITLDKPKETLQNNDKKIQVEGLDAFFGRSVFGKRR